MRSRLKGCLLGVMLASHTVVFADEAQSYDDALTSFVQGDVQASYLVLKQVLRDNPDHLPSKLLMGRILLIDGYVGEAIDELEEVLLAGGDEDLVMPPLSRAYLFAGMYNKVFSILNRHTLSDDARLSVTLVAGSAHIRLNERDAAVRLYTRTLKDFPDSLALLNAQTNLLIDLQRLDAAQQILDKSLQLDPKAPFTLLAKGKLVAAKGKTKQSLEIFREAYAIAPENPATMRAYAGALAEAGEYDHANKLIADIEAQTPGDVQNQLLKARILALTQNQLAADKILRELTERLSLLTDEQLNEQIELSLIAGIVAYLNKNYDMASTELNRYIGKRDATPEQLGMLTDAMLRTGAYKDAAKLLEKNEELVVKNLNLAQLNCELFMLLKRPFKCEQLLPELTRRYQGEEQFAVLQAKLFLNTRKLAAANEILRNELADSDNEEVLKLKIALLTDRRDFASALTLAQQLLTRFADNIDYQAITADLLIRNNKLDEATVLVNTILEDEPGSVPGLVARSRIQYYKGNYPAARRAIDDALKMDKTSVAARVLAAQIYLASDMTESAIEHLVAAKTLDKKDLRSRELLLNIYRKEGNNKAALSEANALLAIDRLSPDYHLQKAAILNELKDAEGAKTQLNMVYALWAKEPHKLMSLARFQRRAKDFEGAMKSYETAIRLVPSEPLPYMDMAAFQIKQELLNQAQLTIEEITQRFGPSADVSMLYGDLAVARGSLAAGFDFYLQALQQDSAFTTPLLKAFTLAKDGVKRQALITYLSRVTASNPDNLFGQNLLADLHYLNNDYTKATPMYEALLTSDKLTRRAFVLNNLANIYSLTSPLKAMALIEEALALEPRSAALLDTKGWILALDNDYLGGLGVLRQAYILDASDPSVQYHIAYTLAKLDRQQEARELLEEHDTLAKQFREKSDAQKLAQAL